MQQREMDSMTIVAKSTSSSGIKGHRSILKTKEEDDRAFMMEKSDSSNKYKRSVSFGASTEILFDKELPSSDVVGFLCMPYNYRLCHDRWGTCVARDASSGGCNHCNQSSVNDIPRQPAASVTRPAC
jgi:hypothetical protein